MESNRILINNIYMSVIYNLSYHKLYDDCIKSSDDIIHEYIRIRKLVFILKK
jgi:hypothetical protein